MVKTDKKESVMHEDVNMKNVDKLKAAARDFGKNRDINSKSIEDALMTIVQSMRVLDKSTSGRADVKHEKIISKQIVRINNIINKTNYGKTGQSEEGKEIVKILNKHKLNGPRGFHKVIYEGVEMNEASKVPAGMKFIASYVYKDANGKDHTHRHLRKGTKMTDPVVVYIDDKEWKTFQSFTKAKQAAISHIKSMKESVEMNDDGWVVVGKGRKPVRFLKNPKNNKAPRNWQKSSDETEVIRVSKAKQMGIIKKESVDLEEENKIFFVKVGDGRDSMTVKTKARNSREALKKMRSEHPKSRVSLDINQKQGQPAGALESVDLEEKNVPTNPALWAKMKAQAKAKFDVYPSAYANGWAAKKYKAAGGGWKTTKESTEMKSFWDIRESVEMNEEFVVKYAKNKRGPIYQTKFKTQPEAEKFLAQKRKEGMNGIVSKAGKPVSMQKMKDLQKS